MLGVGALDLARYKAGQLLRTPTIRLYHAADSACPVSERLYASLGESLEAGIAEFILQEALRVVVAKGQLIATAVLALPIKPLSPNLPPIGHQGVAVGAETCSGHPKRA